MAQYGFEGEPTQGAAVATPSFAGIPTRNNDAALFVGGLSFSATEEDLRQAFGFVGTIVSVRIVQDRDTGKPRGFAFVNFETPECVDTAIRECQGMELCGRNVRLDRSAAGIVGRGKGGKGGMGGYLPYHPAEFAAMYHRGYPMVPHYPPMYHPAAGYPFPFPPAGPPPPPTSEQSGLEHQQSGQSPKSSASTTMSGGPPPPPPPPPHQFMLQMPVGFPPHAMVSPMQYSPPAPPAPPAPPSSSHE
jgi:RNA recognition motif-containing protein